MSQRIFITILINFAIPINQFTVYEWMKTLASSYRHEDNKDKQPVWTSLLLGSTSKIIAATVTYPYQVIKSRMQQREILESTKLPSVSLGQSPAIGGRRYNGMLDCMVKIYRDHGVPGFFRGVVPNAMKVAPSAALTFVVFEESMKFLKDHNISF